MYFIEEDYEEIERQTAKNMDGVDRTENYTYKVFQSKRQTNERTVATY